MKGGTYAEALKVGFTEQQAGFFGRMNGEIVDEAVDVVRYKDEMSRVGQAKQRRRRNGTIFWATFMVILGIVIGKLA
jgi:hypothetical protein